MKKTIRLTERDLTRIVKRTIKEMRGDENKTLNTLEDFKNEVDDFLDKNRDNLDNDELFRELNHYVARTLRKKINRANMMGSFTNDDLNQLIQYVNGLKYSDNY